MHRSGIWNGVLVTGRSGRGRGTLQHAHTLVEGNHSDPFVRYVNKDKKPSTQKLTNKHLALTELSLDAKISGLDPLHGAALGEASVPLPPRLYDIITRADCLGHTRQRYQHL